MRERRTTTWVVHAQSLYQHSAAHLDLSPTENRLMKQLLALLSFLMPLIGCSPTTATVDGPEPYSISYTASFGLHPNEVLLEVNPVGKASLVVTDRVDNVVVFSAEEQLLDEERADLGTLVAKFTSFRASYTPGSLDLVDGDNHRIKVSRADYDHQVHVYRPEQAEIPADLHKLLGRLQDIEDRISTN